MAFLATRCNSRFLFDRLLTRSLVSLNPERTVTVKSKQFPEYSLLYDFAKIKTASKVNRAKYMSTVFYACASPTLIAAQTLTGMITPDYVGSFLFYGGFITVFLHSIGFLFNNAIGYIYIKDDNESVKFSCVGYWGERVDVDTSVDKICAFDDEPSKLNNPWYQKVRLTDSKTVYKIYDSVGEVLDPKLFAYIFGGLAAVKKCD